MSDLYRHEKKMVYKRNLLRNGGTCPQLIAECPSASYAVRIARLLNEEYDRDIHRLAADVVAPDVGILTIKEDR